MDYKLEKKVVAIPFGEIATAATLKSITHLVERQLANPDSPVHPLISGPGNDSPNIVTVNFNNTVQSIMSGASYLHGQTNQAQLQNTIAKEHKKPVKLYDYSVHSADNPFNFLSGVQVG
jgi:hypothetical protein